MIALVLAVALSQAADVPLVNPDAKGHAVVLKPGDTYTATSKVVVLDEQEDVHRERDRVGGRAGEAFWRKVAIGSIVGGAVVVVTSVVLGAVVATKK